MNEIVSSSAEKTLNYSPLIELNLNGKRGTILSDIHIPFFDKTSLNLALERSKQKKIDFLYLNGDILDFYAISHFNRNPERKFVKPEIDKAVNILKDIRKAFPKIKIFYKVGNHEDRLSNFIWTKSPELTGLSCLNLESLLCFDELKIIKIESGQVAKMGKLYVFHGHELGKGNGMQINTARNLRLKAGTNALQGHWHRNNNDVSRNAGQKIQSGYTTGCLCELNPAYAPFNQWTHGFAEIEIDKNGNYILDNRIIIDGSIR